MNIEAQLQALDVEADEDDVSDTSHASVGCVARCDGKEAERCREEYGYTFHVVRD